MSATPRIYELENKEFDFVNSGAIISKTDVFYNYLVKLTELCLENKIDFWDDQGVWQFYNLTVKKASINSLFLRQAN
jgi:hypothetical protein